MKNEPLIPPDEENAAQRLPLTQRLSKQALNILRVIILVGVIALTLVLLIYRERIQALQGLGYPGIFLFSILANATILVPIPGVVFTSAMGAVFHPLWVSVAAGSGAALGELSGYLAGFSGQAVVEKNTQYDRVVTWMRNYGDLTILFLAFIPNPIFDLAGIAAGILKMPIARFLFYCLIGKVLKMMVFAYAGDWIIRLLESAF
jgi:uncharacterized membrane protein YdjX (TVP38/TMEM64 family)